MVLLYVVWRGSLVKRVRTVRGYRAPKALVVGPGRFRGRRPRVAPPELCHRAMREGRGEGRERAHDARQKCRRCSSNVERSSARDEKTVIYPVCLQLYFSAIANKRVLLLV